MLIDFRKYPVLFVDDEEANRIVFRASLGQEFRVLLAANATEALNILRETSPAIIIIDQRMPGMSGVELAELAREKYPEMVRVIVTAYSDLQVAIDAINRGQVSHFIRKPWDTNELRTLIRNAIQFKILNMQVQDLQAQVFRAERLATLGLTATSISHDLSTPVSCLLNDIAGLDDEICKLRDDMRDQPRLLGRLEYFLEITRDLKASAEEVCRILNAIRGSIQSHTEKEVVQLGTMIRTALRLIQTKVVHKAALFVEGSSEISVIGDPSALTQVVINLLINAANAIQKGTPSQNRIDIILEEDDVMAILKVRDTGCGIPQELVGRIFEPLFTTHPEDGGTGLGLSIVKKIVDAHQGTISVDSVVGEGTIFTIKLPKAPPPPSRTSSPS